MAGRAKENLPGGSPQYLFIYLKVRIFECSYRMFEHDTTILWPSLPWCLTGTQLD